jgi:hypothetical protein
MNNLSKAKFILEKIHLIKNHKFDNLSLSIGRNGFAIVEKDLNLIVKFTNQELFLNEQRGEIVLNQLYFKINFIKDI